KPGAVERRAARTLLPERPEAAPDPASHALESEPREPLSRRPALEAAPPAGASVRDEFFLPDFCTPRSVFAVVLVAELLAVVFALARPGAPFLTELGRVSLFVQWPALTSAALLCFTRPQLTRYRVPWASAAVFLLLALNTALISIAALALGAGAMERDAAAPL